MTSGKFISRLTGINGQTVPIKVIEAGMQDALEWDQTIQRPWIAQSSRIDANWRWKTIYLRSMVVELLARRRIAYMQLSIAGRGGSAFPVGQLLMADGFPYPPDKKPCIFLWYLTRAPAEANDAAGAPRVNGVLDALVDTAIQFSYMRGFGGRLCLHASPDGDAKQRAALMARYQGVGLELWKWGAFVSWFRRDDGRYFVADEVVAAAITKRLDPFR